MLQYLKSLASPTHLIAASRKLHLLLSKPALLQIHRQSSLPVSESLVSRSRRYLVAPKPFRSTLKLIRPMTTSVKAVNDLKNLERPTAEKRDFRHVTLANDLEAILISDPKCDRAAAALCVGVGSLMDPKNLQGCAHFLEHMLFLGTKKYPDEGSYTKYLKEHAGSYNAFTCSCETCYHFSVAPDALEGALDRFAQFFLHPLFTAEAVDREMDAVDSEHSKNLLSDDARLYQMLRQSANPNHPMHQFSTGNSESLRQSGVDARDVVIQFYHKYYSAHLMKLCIIGKESLQELQDYVTSIGFQNIPRNQTEIPRGDRFAPNIEAWRSQDLAKMIKIVPIREVRQLHFAWILPSQTELWRTKPVKYLLNLLGHEGRGSLLSRLKNQGFATRLVTNIETSFHIVGKSIFTCFIELTESGMDHIEEIGRSLFEYVHLLTSNPINEAFWEESTMQANLHFQNASIAPPEVHAVMMSDAMLYYPPEFVYSGESKVFEKNFDQIQQLLKYLTPENLIVRVLSPSFNQECENWEEEHWYKIKYLKEDLPGQYMEAWRGSLNGEKTDISTQAPFHFPKPNIYNPQSLSLKPAPTNAPKYPQKLSVGSLGNQSIHCWFKQDTTFKLPKASAMFKLCSPYPRKNVHKATLYQLYLMSIKEAMNEDIYEASEAGLSYIVSSALNSGNIGELTNGMVVLVSGFDEPLPKLLNAILNHFENPSYFTEKHFEIAKKVLKRQLLVDITHMQPYKQAAYQLRRLCQKPFYSPSARLECVERIQFEDVQKAIPEMLSNLIIEGFIGGNVTQEDAQAYLKLLTEKFGPQLYPNPVGLSQDFPWSQSLDLATLQKVPQPARLRLSVPSTNPKDVNSASLISIHFGPTSPNEAACLNFLRKYLHQPFFEALRTKQQLGYITSTTLLQTFHCDVLGLFVQSKALPAYQLTLRIEAFLEHYLTNVRQLLKETEFEDMRQSMILNLSEEPTSLEEEAQRYIDEISLRRYAFDRRSAQIEFLKTFTLEKFIDFIESHVMKYPWVATEIVSPLAPEKTADRDVNHEVPLEPSHPINWTQLPDNLDDFEKTNAPAYVKFALPGATICSR